ncbi:DUF839 domain-containing protein [Rhizohabitans arisaemae]|uniref:DUF839 domain-containing protein n=1 Tax=Rhizohabitans arisaemae TaxID=2720610 RepID=UPI0024B2644B|nr:DUF839 domain-containing protein [Rhizohabitans arisaemae]
MNRSTLRSPGVLRGNPVPVVGALWRAAHLAGSGSSSGPGPYGPLCTPDRHGLALPWGFTAKVVAASGHRVGGLTWPAASAAGACLPDGPGWVYVSNAAAPVLGGVCVIRFGAEGTPRGACRVLSGTDRNRAGGPTPWRTWLSAEDTARGRLFETDPYGVHAAIPRLATGRFRRGDLACDPERGTVYMVEDEPDGCLYRFRPAIWGDLSSGVLEVMAGPPGSPAAVRWERVPDPSASCEPLRAQVPAARRFDGARSLHHSAGVCYFAAGGDGRVWGYDTRAARLDVVYDAHTAGGSPAAGLRMPDLLVADDAEGGVRADTVTGTGGAAPFLELTGEDRPGIEDMTFSPDGRRLYLATRQAVYEISGPFPGE